MRRGVFVVLLSVFSVLLIPFVQGQIFCSALDDCPIPACLTALRSCQERLCSYTPCILTGESTPDGREQFGRNEFEHYTKLTGIGESDIEAHTLDRSTLSKINFVKVFKSFKIALLFLGGALIVAVCVALGRMGPKGKLVAAVLAVAIVAGASLQIGLNMTTKDPATLWKKTRISDFESFRLTDDIEEVTFATQKKQLISEYLIDLKQYRRVNGGKETVLTILEFPTATHVEQWQVLGGRRFELERIFGENVYSTDLYPGDETRNEKLYLWDEDRFIFLAAGFPRLMRDDVVRIVKRYPYRAPDFFSRLMIEDVTPPEIYELRPGDQSATTSHEFSFMVSDDLNLDKDSITVEGIPGFSLKQCEENELAEMVCAFTTNFQPGVNAFTISAADRSENIKTLAVRIYFDIRAPEIVNITPKLGAYVNESRITITVEDDYSIDRTGIEVIGLEGFSDGKTDCYYRNGTVLFCPFTAEPIEGVNNFQIIARDSAGNALEHNHFFTYISAAKVEFVKPKPGEYISTNVMTFSVRDSSGIEQKSILVSHGAAFEDIISECKVFGYGFEATYTCQHQMDFTPGSNTVTISVVDTEGSVYKIPINFFYDNIPPQVGAMTIDKDPAKGYARVDFELLDDHSGINIDSFNLQRLDLLSVNMDCERAGKSYSCYVEMNELSSGDHSFDVYINDKAGNMLKETIEVII